MAEETKVSLYIGTDFDYAFHILNEAKTQAIDITGWTLSWMLKRKATDEDVDALLVKTTTAGGVVIAGAFNATPGLNLQRATVTVQDTDTDALAAASCRFELKRMDAGVETVLADGPLTLKRSVHHT